MTKRGHVDLFVQWFLQFIKDQGLQLYHHFFGSPSSEYLDILRMGSASTRFKFYVLAAVAKAMA